MCNLAVIIRSLTGSQSSNDLDVCASSIMPAAHSHVMLPNTMAPSNVLHSVYLLHRLLKSEECTYSLFGQSEPISPTFHTPIFVTDIVESIKYNNNNNNNNNERSHIFTTITTSKQQPRNGV